jgi:CDP-6-deoxy-D-xylo-4-hexulose-3-dehydrase
VSFKFPLATSSWDQDEYNALQRVIKSDRYSMGSEVFRFEAQFAEYFGAKYAVMVNSGSSANLLMVSALLYSKDPKTSLSSGDQVIVPAVSWSTTYYPLAQCGLVQKFVDIDLETLNYDMDVLEAAIDSDTRAIMVVNLLGNPNEFDKLTALANKYNLLLLEDNCESMGSVFNGKYAGTFGVVGSFSTYFSHHISTMEGGVVVTDNEELYHIMLSLRSHGWTRNLPKFNKVTGVKSDDPMEESFNFVLPGYNLRPLEMSGALGVEQLKKLPSLLEGRRQNASVFQDILGETKTFRIQKEVGISSWFGFSLILTEETDISRADFADALNKAGFECRPIVSGNFAAKLVMKHMPHKIHQMLSNADYVDRRGLFVGNHHYDISDAAHMLAELDFKWMK